MPRQAQTESDVWQRETLNFLFAQEQILMFNLHCMPWVDWLDLNRANLCNITALRQEGSPLNEINKLGTSYLKVLAAPSGNVIGCRSDLSVAYAQVRRATQ